MRIDRLLCELNLGSRKEVKELLKKGLVCVDGQVIKKADTQIEEQSALVTCQGKSYRYRPYVYYMLNKPSGVITATTDPKEKTVMDLFREGFIRRYGDTFGVPFGDMFPVGRLDKDTIGLLLLTNDGALAHNLLSPKKHVEKRYEVALDGMLTKEMIRRLEDGVDIGEGKFTEPAKIQTDETDLSKCYITITEGKFHQVKRMFQAVGLKVVFLKRESMGSLILDQTLKEGEFRELTVEELLHLQKDE